MDHDDNDDDLVTPDETQPGAVPKWSVCISRAVITLNLQQLADAGPGEER